MNREEVLKLAKLARIEIGEAEAESLSHEFEAILQYVSEIKNATSPQPLSLSKERGKGRGVFNVMREDTSPHESGIFTEALLNEAPARQKDFVKVKKIL